MSYFNPFEYLNIGALYAGPNASLFFDSVIYLIIFLGIATRIFTKAEGAGGYGKRHGKPVAIGIALALTFSMIMWETMSGWRIGTSGLHIVGVIIIGIIFLALFYTTFKDMFNMHPACAAALSYLLAYSGTMMLFDTAVVYAYHGQFFIGDLLTLLYAIALISLFVCLPKLFSGLFGGGTAPTGGATPSLSGGPAPGPTPSPRDPRLTVALSEPRENAAYDQGTPVPILGTVSGGTGNVAWEVYVHDSGRWISGRTRIQAGTGDTIRAQHVFNDIGQKRITVQATDGRSTANARVNFTIRPPRGPPGRNPPAALINQFIILVQQLQALVPQWRAAGTRAARVYYAYRHLGATQPQLQQAIATFVNLGNQIAVLINNNAPGTPGIRQLSRQIATHLNAGMVTPPLLQQYGTSYHDYLTMAHTVSTYWMQWQQTMNRGGTP